MHANIAAISLGVPTVAIAYSHKAPGIMRMVGLEKYICDFRTMTFEELTAKVDDMWSNREKIVEKMAPKIEDLKESVWLNGKLVKDLLNSSKIPQEKDSNG
jgi:colanic acid/amylovoran biosynthesis protein